MKNNLYVCGSCGHVGNYIKKNKGSAIMEFFLYIFIVSIPFGLVYSIYRRTNRDNICPKCKLNNMIPADSPNGKKILDSRNSA